MRSCWSIWWNVLTRLNDLWIRFAAHTQILEAYAQLLDFDTYGSINVEGLYTPGRQSRPQCDMSCMISREMFREFVVPCLNYEADDVDAMHYHLDGPGAIHHLKALCEIEGLDVISWVPGTGEGQTQDWTALYKKIDDLGKGQTRGASHEDIDVYGGNTNHESCSFTRQPYQSRKQKTF